MDMEKILSQVAKNRKKEREQPKLSQKQIKEMNELKKRLIWRQIIKTINRIKEIQQNV